MSKVYFPQDGQIQVHQLRVTHCPTEFSAGYYWYGMKKHSPGHPAKWVEQLLSSQSPSDQNCAELQTDQPEQSASGSDCESDKSDDENDESNCENDESENESSESEPAKISNPPMI